MNMNTEAFYVNGFKLLGLVNQQDIVFEYAPTKSAEECSLENINSFECNTLLSNDPEFLKKKNEYLKKVQRENAFDAENKLYMCFGKEEATNKIQCESWEIKNNQKVKPGVWGKRKCTINEECPYYKSNKNYENSRGGCVNGLCEVPINVRLLTPTMVDTNTKPLCHNCNVLNCSGIECSQCCDEQEDYPNMKSPDYAFDNDFNERLENKTEFENNGYSPFKLSFYAGIFSYFQ